MQICLPASSPSTLAAMGRLACCLMASAMLAGCAGSSPSENGLASKTPQEIVAAAKAAAAGAATVHVAGSILDARTPISVDMR